ncbi:MAG TPA: hypothetical protein VG672_03240 [Bryobacteraceae bacterium]|jgi:hypothetical protein|nr:hypothetical protein [Bryobacteraceae bacterium]
MANSATNSLLVTFQQAAGAQIDSAALVSQLDALRSVSETQVEAISSNTAAVDQNTSSRSIGDTAASVAGSLAKNALSMLPLVGMFASLFGGGGGSTETAAPVKYTAPAPIQFEGSTSVTYAAPPSSASTPVASTSSSTAGPQVTIQVQAMDSRSFLDHSAEIAQAVREAMLNLHPLNDVVSDL